MDSQGRTQAGKLYQNSKYSFYTYGAEASQFSFSRGQMHFALADWSQDIMSSNIAYPQKPVALSDTDYLHVTYEVGSDATGRRYWWLVLCGADTTGATLGSDGKLMGNIIQTPFFMDSDGLNPSVEGWNCLQVFPRQGWPFSLAPDDTNPESEVRVMVNKAGNLGRSSVVNVSPLQYSSTNIGPPSWFRTQDAKGNFVGKILDDQQLHRAAHALRRLRPARPRGALRQRRAAHLQRPRDERQAHDGRRRAGLRTGASITRRPSASSSTPATGIAAASATTSRTSRSSTCAIGTTSGTTSTSSLPSGFDSSPCFTPSP